MYVMSPYILVRSDLGERGIVTDLKLASASNKQVKHEVVPSPPSKIGKVQREAESMTRLNYDDLLVIKSSFESFLAVRHEVYGSLMIRALVSTMYKHAGHRHMCEIFKNTERVNRLSSLKDYSCLLFYSFPSLSLYLHAMLNTNYSIYF
ncbi:hypothetical protein EB796_002987 [Bugula neritina]|uniref:Caspase family p10 domain-containing protein n=1 Tax=Bugula neritina TaxID=10212 RepID=A0A7J7KK95_BUGNE|nr:hypothetical protein EB796_002987 [Bugula neritina]